MTKSSDNMYKKMISESNKKLKKKPGVDIDLSLLEDLGEVEYLSSGSIVLDRILGGGFPINRITEIYGDTSTGKSLIASQAIAVAQELGWICVLLDTESAVSVPIMNAIGVDTEKLIYEQPDTVEDVFEMIDSMIDTKLELYPDVPMLIVWDSIAATSSRLEMASEYGKSNMGRIAQMNSQALRKIVRKFHDNAVCAIFTNQTRQKIGITFGDNEATSGGKAVAFYSSVRLRLKLGKKLIVTDGKKKRIVGMSAKAEVVKNKCAVPFLYAELPIYFGSGIDDSLATFEYLKENKYLETSGSWYTVTLADKEIKFQKKNWNAIFEENMEAIDELIFSDEGSYAPYEDGAEEESEE